MQNFKWLGLGLVLGMGHAACDGGDDDRADTGAATTAAPGEGSTDPTDAEDEGGEADSGEPGGDSNDGGEESTSADPPDPSAGDEAGEEESEGGGEAGGSPETGVRGAVIRSVAPAAGQDAIGTLYVGLLIECTADSEQAGGATPVVGADLSAEGSQVLYEVTGVAAGTYYLVAFLDDNLNADASNPYADNADLVTAEGFAPGCVEVTITDGEIATAPAAVDLNLVYPL